MIEQNLMKWQHMTMIYAYHKTGTINSIIRILLNDNNALFLELIAPAGARFGVCSSLAAEAKNASKKHIHMVVQVTDIWRSNDLPWL